MKELLIKIAKVKDELKPIVKTEKNPFFKSSYFDINSLLKQVEPKLSEHKLLLVQPIENGSVWSYIYDLESNQSVHSSIALPSDLEPQKMGAAITYYRRYTLQSLLALEANDDDAEKTRPKGKPELKRGSEKWDQAVEYMSSNQGDIEAIKKKYKVSPSDEASLKNA